MQVPTQLMTNYLERRKRDLQDCLLSLQKQNYLAIEKVGHQLKGNGEIFGHPELSYIGRNLEKAAISKDIFLIENVLKEFSYWVYSKT